MNKEINWRSLIMWWSGIIFFWLGSACFLFDMASRRPHPKSIPPGMSDFATVFFGASSIALVIVSLVLAFVAIVGWGAIKAELAKEIAASESSRDEIRRSSAENQERVDHLTEKMDAKFKKIQERTNGLEKELRGRVNTAMGVMMGTAHSNPLLPKQEERNRDYIDEAIYFCDKGYEMLKDLEGHGKFMALNNLVYFSSLFKIDSRGDFLLEQGRTIKEVGQRFKAGAYLLTFCRVAWVYASDPNELRQALAIADSLDAEMELTNRQKKEAAFLATSLRTRIGELASPTN